MGIMCDPQIVQSLLQIHQEGNGGPLSGIPCSVAYMPPVDFNSSCTDIEKSSDRNYIAILAILSHSFSRGSVHIKSPDIREKPEFGPNYLSHTLELELLARHTQFIDRLAHTEPL